MSESGLDEDRCRDLRPISSESMINQPALTLVLGEAPESDDETEENVVVPSVPLNSSKPEGLPVVGLAVSGEALESDEEVDEHNFTAASPVDRCGNQEKSTTKTLEVQAVASKKLREENRLLYEGLTAFKRQILTSTNYELTNVNQQLLKSQVELQQTLNHTRQVKANLNDFERKLNDIVLADYIPKINVKVPKNII